MSEIWVNAIIFFDTSETAEYWADVFRKVTKDDWSQVEAPLKKLGLIDRDKEIDRGLQFFDVYQSHRRVNLSFSEGSTSVLDILKNLNNAVTTHIKATIDNPQTATSYTICQIGNRKVKQTKFIEAVSAFDNEFAFIQAIIKGNVADIDRTIAAGVDPNKEIAPKWFPLHAAIIKNKKAIVSKLIEAGADINVQTSSDDPDLLAYKQSRTPLHIAVFNGRKALVRLLLKEGADYSLRNGKGETPLHIAIGHQDKDICKLLIKAGADPNEKTPQGETAIFNTSSSDGDKLVEFMLFIESMGADINCVNDTGANLRWVYGSSPEIRVFYTERNIALSRPDNAYSGDLALDLLVAINHYDIEKIDELLSLDFNINEPVTTHPSLQKAPSIIAAVRQNSIDIVKRLLDAGADIHAVSEARFLNSLHWAAFLGYKEMVVFLVEKGANVNVIIESSAGRQIADDAVLMALEQEHVDVVLTLIDKWKPSQERLEFGIYLAERISNEDLLDRIKNLRLL
jgi:ankyrin repeat protein